MAHELFEKLLQTVQGAKLVADDALDRPDDAAAMRNALAKISIWLEQVVNEGWACLHANDPTRQDE